MVIEGVATRGTVEGIVPASAGSMLTINAVVPNQQGTLVAGGAATMRLQQGSRSMLLVPATAILREGDLTGVTVVDGTATGTRWVRLGATYGDRVEVIAGLRVGDTIIVPSGAKE